MFAITGEIQRDFTTRTLRVRRGQTIDEGGLYISSGGETIENGQLHLLNGVIDVVSNTKWTPTIRATSYSEFPVTDIIQVSTTNASVNASYSYLNIMNAGNRVFEIDGSGRTTLGSSGACPSPITRSAHVYVPDENTLAIICFPSYPLGWQPSLVALSLPPVGRQSTRWASRSIQERSSSTTTVVTWQPFGL